MHQRVKKSHESVSYSKSSDVEQPQQQALQTKKKKLRPKFQQQHNVHNHAFIESILKVLLVILFFAINISTYLVFFGSHSQSQNESTKDPHLYPRAPILPIFAPVPNAETLIQQTLSGQNPTIAGIVAILQNFLSDWHKANYQLSQTKSKNVYTVINALFNLTTHHLLPLEQASYP